MKRQRAILLEAVSTGVQAGAMRQSLPEQDRRLLEVGEARDWDIVDVIVVPGFSRVYYTYREFAEAALADGIAAPMRMFDHWKKRDFDVLAVSTGDRFGREQSIFAEVVVRTIDGGATVFTLRDGDIDRSNYRMFISMGGYSAAGEIDELVRRHKFGMAKNAARGLALGAHGHIPSHVMVGKKDEARTVVNEDARRLFADIAELLLARVSWRQMPPLLAERGHVRANGTLHSPTSLRLWLMHPTLWGNTAQNFQNNERFSVGRGFWVFDPAEPHPEHVTVHYGTHPPMYEGVQARRIQAELRRRFSDGRPQPAPRRMFSGLVVCNVCHYSTRYKQVGAWLGVRCPSQGHPDLDQSCTNTRTVNEKKLVAAAQLLLDQLAAQSDWSVLFGEVETDSSAERLAAVERELTSVKEQAGRLYDERASVPTIFREQFNKSVETLAARATALEGEQARLRVQVGMNAPTPDQILALEDYRELEDGALWRKDSAEINQWLRRLMGKRRFVIDDGEVKGTSAQVRQRPRTKGKRRLTP